MSQTAVQNQSKPYTVWTDWAILGLIIGGFLLFCAIQAAGLVYSTQWSPELWLGIVLIINALVMTIYWNFAYDRKMSILSAAVGWLVISGIGALIIVLLSDLFWRYAAEAVLTVIANVVILCNAPGDDG